MERNRQKGFSLIELLVALLIISISSMAIIPLLISSLHLNKATDLAAKAKDLATQKVEELMVTPREVVDGYLGVGTSYTGPTEYITENGEVFAASNSRTIFTRQWGINEPPGLTADPKPVALTAVVKYTYKGELKTRTFTTMWSF